MTCVGRAVGCAFGCRKSPEIFHRLTQAVKRMMSRRGYEDVFVYLDNFLIVGNTKSACQAAYDTLLQLLKDLGFQISARKLVPPTQCLTFLGVQLDTVRQEMSLPEAKLEELQALISQFAKKHRVNKKQLQRLAGKLNRACRVVFGGRTFLRRVLDTMNALSSRTAKCRLSKEFHQDLHWWDTFLKRFNGKCMFLDE